MINVIAQGFQREGAGFMWAILVFAGIAMALVIERAYYIFFRCSMGRSDFMRIILTRHGQTEENLQGILQGHLQGKLSQLGKEQARKLALRLKDEKIDYIYSSDLARAADTAKEIAKYHPDTPIKFVKDMREPYHHGTGIGVSDQRCDHTIIDLVHCEAQLLPDGPEPPLVGGVEGSLGDVRRLQIVLLEECRDRLRQYLQMN